jgi:hypothetical protein
VQKLCHINYPPSDVYGENAKEVGNFRRITPFALDYDLFSKSTEEYI